MDGLFAFQGVFLAKPLIQGADAINSFNLQMRQQPWYQDWFRSQGLDPNRAKLSKQQRQQLEQVVLAHGAPSGLFQDMEIDPAGNLNNEHGFASQPTWLKALEIGGAVAAGGYGASAALGGGTAGGGAAAGGGGAAAGGGIPSGASAAALGGGGTAAGTAGAFSWGKLAPMLVGGGLQALGSFQQARAANKASEQMVDASNRALDFSKGIYADQKANQTPFIQTGQGALSGLNQMLRIPQAAPTQTPAPQGPLSSLSTPGGMTLMKAPDGSTRLVSASQVPLLMQRGATVAQ